jgi:serine/threonine protein kinase
MDPQPNVEPSLDDPRLLLAVKEYLAEIESGKTTDRRAFVARFPDLASQLEPYLEALDRVHSAAPHLKPAASSLALNGSLAAEALGDFRIVREIGRGGMGIVYEAVQMSLGRNVALKVLPFAAALDSKQLQRFKNEAQAAAQLHHAHIVPVYAVGCEHGIHYYAMQLIEGQNLADLIDRLEESQQNARRKGLHSRTTRRREDGAKAQTVTVRITPPAFGKVPAPETVSPAAMALSTQRANHPSQYFRSVVRLAAQAAQALEHAHQFGVIHRDIKPGNLLLDPDGNIWVTDFGLAQLNSCAGLTRTGDVLGTLRYMSPEQAAAQHAPSDPRTDVYSLGATLYELLTLQPLFDGADRGRLLQQILNEEPWAPRSIEPSIPQELETIVLKAISKNPSDRYATAREFAEDLQCFLDNLPIHARRPTLIQRIRKWAVRHPSIVIAGVLLSLLTAAGSLTSAVLINRERENTRAAYTLERERARQTDALYRLAARSLDDMVELSGEELLDRPDLQGLRKRVLNAVLVHSREFIDYKGDDPDAEDEIKATRKRVETILADLDVLRGAWQLQLLENPDVLDDLALSAANRKKLAGLATTMRMRQKELRTETRDLGLSSEERRKRLVDLARASTPEVRNVLTAEQLQRLEQIDLQFQGPDAFTDPEVADALKLTPEQKATIRDILDQFREHDPIDHHGPRPRDHGSGPEDRPPPPRDHGPGPGDRPPPPRDRGPGPGGPDRGPPDHPRRDRGGPDRGGPPHGRPDRGRPPKDGPDGEPPDRRGPPGDRERERRAAVEKILLVLTAEQRAQWKKTIGKRFAGPMFDPFGPPR